MNTARTLAANARAVLDGYATNFPSIHNGRIPLIDRDLMQFTSGATPGQTQWPPSGMSLPAYVRKLAADMGAAADADHAERCTDAATNLVNAQAEVARLGSVQTSATKSSDMLAHLADHARAVQAAEANLSAAQSAHEQELASTHVERARALAASLDAHAKGMGA